MKAFLLAAGVGSRLRPLTDTVPKCLVPVGGKPLLEIWLELLVAHGVTDVLINTHHLAATVEAFVACRQGRGPRVELFYEAALLGSAGTVAANRAFVDGEQSFLVIYADNLTDVDVSGLCRFHAAKHSPFTMGLFHAAQPRECGIASLDAAGRVTAFDEKPENPTGDLANAGLYVADQSIFERIPDTCPVDFGFDVLPGLVGSMYGYPINAFYADIGTPDRLTAARAAWSQRRTSSQE